MRELTTFIRSIRERIINYYHIDRVGKLVWEIVRGFSANYRELVELCGHKKPRHNGRGVLGMVLLFPFPPRFTGQPV
jgi:hypothetical protein